jgi:hypothetical protein
MNKITLNNEDYNVTEKELPYLVVYGRQSGGSHFTLTLVKDLFLSGSKILFLTAFHMAKDSFLEQVGTDHSQISFVTNTDELKNAQNSQCIIIESGNENLFIESIKILPDINERVVLVKNIEAFSMPIFDHSLNLNKIIISGDIDNCVAKDEIIKKSFETIVAFNKTETVLPIEVPVLEKWSGYLSSQSKKGIIKVLV